jgi:hypothetical protein
MPSSEPAHWQPMSQMPLVAGLIDGALRDTRDHLHTLTKARAKPHVLDDATVDRIERVHREQLEFDVIRRRLPVLRAGFARAFADSVRAMTGEPRR